MLPYGTQAQTLVADEDKAPEAMVFPSLSYATAGGTAGADGAEKQRDTLHRS